MENEVLTTTARVLSILNAKYSHLKPEQFSLASHVTPDVATPYEVKVGASPLAQADSTSKSTSSSGEVSASAPTSVALGTFLHPDIPVIIDDSAIDAELDQHIKNYTSEALPPSWAQDFHLSMTDPDDTKQQEMLAQYVLVLDALNFCFWPLQGYEYEHLASSLKQAAEMRPEAFTAESLASVTEQQLTDWLQPPKTFPLIGSSGPSDKILPIPLIEARTRLLNEVGRVLLENFEGKAVNLIRAANKSALRLVKLVTASFPGFRDQAQFGGDQVFFYKRAQIFVGDVWGAFSGRNLGDFHDMHLLTCFADYRIPQLFRGLGILKLSSAFEKAVDEMEEVSPSNPAIHQSIHCNRHPRSPPVHMHHVMLAFTAELYFVAHTRF